MHETERAAIASGDISKNWLQRLCGLEKHMGLVLDVGSSIDKVFMFLGFALLGLGVVFMNKSKGKGE